MDISVQTDLGPAVRQDDLKVALDIAALGDTVRAEMSPHPRALVERMTGDVANAVPARFPEVTAVRARVEKQQPDGLGAEAESVELELTRGT